jgi:hypothetical protein
MSCCLALVSAGCELVRQRSMTVARPRVGPPARGHAALPGVELPQILAVAPGAGRAMGMVVGPRGANPTAANTPWQVVPKGMGLPGLTDRADGSVRLPEQ